MTELRKTDFSLEVAKGKISGHSIVNKFGAAPDFDTADGEVTVWDGAEDGTIWELMNVVYSTTADIDRISSTVAGDTSLVFEIQGLDGSGVLTTLTGVTLDATDARTPVTITSLKRVFRVKCTSSTPHTGHIIVYVNGTITGNTGVPDDNTLIRAVVHPENQQTEMAIYTVPTGYSMYIKQIYMYSETATRSNEFYVRLRVNPTQGGSIGTGCWQLKFRAVVDADNPVTKIYDVPLKIGADTDVELTIETITAAQTASSVIGGFDFYLVQD